MKTRISALMLALFAIATSVWSDEITSLKLTLSVNGGAPFVQSFPASGWEELVLEESVGSIVISKVEMQTSGNVLFTALQGTMYSTSAGGPTGSDGWRTMPLENKGGGKWELEMGEGIDLVETDWLGENKTKTFEFFAQGIGNTGNQFFYNNGGANYKVTFSTGNGLNEKVQFLTDGTATLDLRVDDYTMGYSFNADGSRDPSEEPGRLSSLVIDGFAVTFSLSSGVSADDVSLQYRVYEEGSAEIVPWNRIDASQHFSLGGGLSHYIANNVECNVSKGLQPGRNYVLEVCYQVVADGEYFFVGKDREGGKLHFFIDGGSIQTEGIRGFSLTISCDGDIFTQSFPSEGWENLFVPGQTSSLKVLRVEVDADESLTYMGFCSTIFDTADGWQQDDSAWEWIPLENRGNGYWVLDWGDGRELVQSEWLEESVMKTIEFFVEGGDASGNQYKYNNGNEYTNYRVMFTTGSGGGGGDQKIRFADDVAATLSLCVNGEELTFGYDAQGNRKPQEQVFRDVYSLVIDGFMLLFRKADGVKVSDVSLQYKVYEEGGDGQWNGIGATESYELPDGQMYFADQGIGLAVPDMKFGRKYVLEVMYQVIADGDYFFLGRDREGCKYRFYFDDETGICNVSADGPSAGKVFNLAGQRVAGDSRGVVITADGKKRLQR